MMKDDTKYCTIASSEKDDETTTTTVELTDAFAVNLSHLYVDQPIRTGNSINHEFANLPEIQKLTWTDTFFDDEDDIIAVFDFDYEAMETYYTNIGWASIAATLLYLPLFIAQLVGLVPCYLRKNIQWNARSQHVAITRDGIRFVRDRRSCCWGLSCTDQGKSSKTVPFDKITDCDVEEPAGNSCLCVPNILSTVNIDTASSGTDGRKELRLAGLKNPHGFKKLVWAMKRTQQSHIADSSTNDEVTSLLREIRDELRTNNQLLQQGHIV